MTTWFRFKRIGGFPVFTGPCHWMGFLLLISAMVVVLGVVTAFIEVTQITTGHLPNGLSVVLIAASVAIPFVIVAARHTVID